MQELYDWVVETKLGGKDVRFESAEGCYSAAVLGWGAGGGQFVL
jgi:hypothetical protein